MHGYADLGEAVRNLRDIAEDFDYTTPDGQPVPFEQWPMSRLLQGEVFNDRELCVRRRGLDRDLHIAFSGTHLRDADGNITVALLTLHEATDPCQTSWRFTAPNMGVVFRAGESEDERNERFADAVAENVEAMLHDMDLSLGERDFTKSLGEHLVDEAIDAYVKDDAGQKGLQRLVHRRVGRRSPHDRPGTPMRASRQTAVDRRRPAGIEFFVSSEMTDGAVGPVEPTIVVCRTIDVSHQTDLTCRR